MSDLERTVEAHLCRRVRDAGGLCWKLTGRSGMPDRLVVLPPGRVFLVEVKRQGGRLSRLQEVNHRRLAKVGVQVIVLWGKGDVDRWMASATCDC